MNGCDGTKVWLAAPRLAQNWTASQCCAAFGHKHHNLNSRNRLACLRDDLITSLSQQGNHIFTSGATGTNAAVIRGALRAEKPDLLTVVLPQSLQKQPPESQELLSQVKVVLAL